MHRANNTNFNKPTLSVDNVENYPVEIIGLESNNEESKQMKTSYKAMKDLVNNGIIEQKQLDVKRNPERVIVSIRLLSLNIHLITLSLVYINSRYKFNR